MGFNKMIEAADNLANGAAKISEQLNDIASREPNASQGMLKSAGEVIQRAIADYWAARKEFFGDAIECMTPVEGHFDFSGDETDSK